jgi:flagellar biosynthetic protein FliR
LPPACHDDTRRQADARRSRAQHVAWECRDATLANNLEAFPFGNVPFVFLRQALPQQWGATKLDTGLRVALPMVAMLTFVNLVLGVISRVAAQINVFAIGFPVTLGVGLLGILLTLPLVQQPFTMALERMLAYF